MMDAIAVGFAGHHVDFELDHEARTWIPSARSSVEMMDDDGMFPITATFDGRRYELHSDGTFLEFDL